MTRYSALAVAVLLIGLCGCTSMCQTPFDYCNAVVGADGCPNCNFGARYGSMFAPMYGTPPTTPIQPTPAAETVPAPEEEATPSPSDAPGLYDEFESSDASTGSTADEIASFLESRSEAPRTPRHSHARRPAAMR